MGLFTSAIHRGIGAQQTSKEMYLFLEFMQCERPLIWLFSHVFHQPCYLLASLTLSVLETSLPQRSHDTLALDISA